MKAFAQVWLVVLLAGVGVAAASELPQPVTDADYRPVDMAEVRLGHLLFYDPILSGNRNISCAACHHPRLGTSDGLSLGLGEGGIGLGPERVVDLGNPPEQRIPRNAPALWNLGASEFTVLFHDGRIEVDPERPGGLRTPLDEDMVQGFSGLLSAQTMFPVLSQDEMAGHYSENEISKAVRLGRITGAGGAWDLISERVAGIEAYREMFAAAYPERDEIAFTDISNAIAAFMAFEWRSDDSAFDAHLRGQGALTGDALAGMALFYGEAGCAACHAGPFQTDHGFYAMGEPQLGPGKAARFESHAQDLGRMRVTGRAEDAYRFRVPSLRNVALTAPYGHAGAYRDLKRFVAAHYGGADWNKAQAVLPDLDVEDWRAFEDPAERDAIAAAYEGPEFALGERQVAQLVAFLDSLTGQGVLAGRLGVPEAVPSGLPVDR